MNFSLSTFICKGYTNYFIQRIRNYAGHSKWQNIKATKSENDAARSQLFKSLSAKMKVAITETGDPNPNTNAKLAGLIDQAKRNNMPTNTLNNIIEKLTNTKLDGPLNIIFVRNVTTGVILIIYFRSDNILQLKILLAQISRKFNSKIADNTLLSAFKCASYITASKNCNIDQAMEDAIQTDADDVELLEGDDKTYFQFKGEFLNSSKISTQLRNLGYTIESEDNRCIPISEVQITEEELVITNKYKARLMSEIPGITKIEDNIAS